MKKDNGVAGGSHAMAPSMMGALRRRREERGRRRVRTQKRIGSKAPSSQNHWILAYMDPGPNMRWGPITPQTMEEEKNVLPLGHVKCDAWVLCFFFGQWVGLEV